MLFHVTFFFKNIVRFPKIVYKIKVLIAMLWVNVIKSLFKLSHVDNKNAVRDPRVLQLLVHRQARFLLDRVSKTRWYRK